MALIIVLIALATGGNWWQLLATDGNLWQLMATIADAVADLFLLFLLLLSERTSRVSPVFFLRISSVYCTLSLCSFIARP